MMKKDKGDASEAWRTIRIIPLVMNRGCFQFFFCFTLFFTFFVGFFFFFSWTDFFCRRRRKRNRMEFRLGRNCQCHHTQTSTMNSKQRPDKFNPEKLEKYTLLTTLNCVSYKAAKHKIFQQPIL